MHRVPPPVFQGGGRACRRALCSLHSAGGAPRAASCDAGPPGKGEGMERGGSAKRQLRVHEGGCPCHSVLPCPQEPSYKCLGSINGQQCRPRITRGRRRCSDSSSKVFVITGGGEGAHANARARPAGARVRATHLCGGRRSCRRAQGSTCGRARAGVSRQWCGGVQQRAGERNVSTTAAGSTPMNEE